MSTQWYGMRRDSKLHQLLCIQKAIQKLLIAVGFHHSEALVAAAQNTTFDDAFQMIPRLPDQPTAHLVWRRGDFWGKGKNEEEMEELIGAHFRKTRGSIYASYMRHLLKGTDHERRSRLRRAYLVGYGAQIEFLAAHGVPFRSTMDSWPPARLAVMAGTQRYNKNLQQVADVLVQFFCTDIAGILMTFLGIAGFFRQTGKRDEQKFVSGQCLCFHCMRNDGDEES